MGFIIAAAAAIAFSVAALISIAVGTIGVILYVWRGRSSQQAKRVFWYSLIGGTMIGVIIINTIPFPQAPAGSNYSEWMNEWVIKAMVYAMIPGVSCLLGGITSVFVRIMLRKD